MRSHEFLSPRTKQSISTINSHLATIVSVSFICLLAFAFNPWRVHGPSISKAHTGPNNAPVAVNDGPYTVHESLLLPQVMTNDSDPDGDSVLFDIIGTHPAHGNLTFGATPGVILYRATEAGYVGPDSFTYRVGDGHGAKSGFATVSIDVVNQAPTAATDSYSVHGPTMLNPYVMDNDSDPDGDNILFDIIVMPPTHGHVSFPDGVQLKYTPNPPTYIGPDSFTYRIKDSLGMMAIGTVNITVQNQPPNAVDDDYTIRGSQTQQLLPVVMDNDEDSDVGDTLLFDVVVQNPSHGSISFGSTNGELYYTPQSGFEGIDTFTYKIADNLGQRSNVATVTLTVEGDSRNNGSCPITAPAGGPWAVGQPVNVTNGNMYLQQTDHQVPGAGHAIHLERTYNSKSTRNGLFGRGWSTAYDEQLVIVGTDFVRLNEANGRATYFKRITGTNTFSSLEGDFHGQLTQTAGGYTLSLKDGNTHQFSSTGRLLSLIDRNGNQTTLTYDLGGKLSSVTDPFGRHLSFLVNLSNRVTSIGDPAGIIADYTYGGSGELLTVTYADNSGYTFAYDGSLRLTSVSDKLGNILEAHAYDAQGRATTSEKQGGVEHYMFSYVSATRTDVTDALGRVTKYFFDTSKARNVVTSVEGVCSCGGGGSQVNSWTYDNNLNVTSSTDALSRVTSYTYDAAGNMLTVTNPTGTVTYTYNPFGQVLTRADQMTGVTTNTYSATGNLLTTTDALNNITTFTYDSHGRLLTTTDARNKVTTLTWDTSGRLTEHKNALNNTTTFGYDLRSRVTSATNALSHTITYEYDSAGRLNKIIYPDTTFLQFTYDLAGRRTKVRDPRGNETNLAYDEAYRLTSVTDALNHATTLGYDLMSNRTSVTDALLRVTDYEYDSFNRLKKIIYPPATPGGTRLQETFEYDAVGNVTKKTDTAARDTTYQYDSANRLIKITDPALQITQLEYNARSQNTKVIDALNQQYVFSYDPLNRLTQLTRGGVSMTYVYDAVGNRTQRTDYNSAVTNYTFDDLNRLTNIAYPDSTSATYGYDALSRLTSAANPNGTVTLGYDSLNRITSVTDVWGKTVGYSYDAAGNRTALTVGGAAYASYQYDVVDRLTNLQDAASQTFVYGYDNADRLTSRVAPNGVTTNFTYDGLDRLFELSHTKSPATLAIHQFSYNDASQIASWIGSSGNRNFNYDAGDRLTSVLKMGGNETYAYDAAGNRTTSHLSATYGYQAVNKLTSTASATYTYDNNGNMLTKVDGSGTRNLTWDFENRLKQVTLPGGVTVNYKYDALGHRVQRTTSAGADERFVYDGEDVLLDLNSSLAVVTSYLNAPGVDNHLRQTNTTTGVSYFLTDHLGTTTGLTDASGTVVETLSYDSFGNTAGSTRTRYTYTGRERDPDTGLLYYRARFYDSQLGRFISEDPIGLKGGPNLFAYVDNDPARFTDPYGEQKNQPCTSGCNKTWTDCYAQCIEKHRLDSLLPALGSALPKRLLPPYRVVKSSQPLTTIPSVIAHYVPNVKLSSALRLGGRLISRVATPVLIFEGFYDIGLLGSCAELCHRNPCN